MVNSCCVKGCNNESYPGSPYSYHKFPRNEKLRSRWENVVPGKISKFSVVCSTHFKINDFNPDCLRRTLKPDAVPSIFPNMLVNSENYPSENTSECTEKKMLVNGDNNSSENTSECTEQIMFVDIEKGFLGLTSTQSTQTEPSREYPWLDKDILSRMDRTMSDYDREVVGKKLKQFMEIKIMHKQKIKNLNQKIARLKKKNAMLKKIVKELKP